MNAGERGIWSLKPTKLDRVVPVPSDIRIVRSINGKLITQLCSEINIGEHEYDLYGKYKCKLLRSYSANDEQRQVKSNYVVVTGITPTSFGEGKSTTTIGITQALSAHLGKNSVACIRQPSQGPTFGMKGGAAGGGYSQVWPMDEFNMHLTGDIHAITAANNLVAAAIDARMFHESTQNDADLYRRLVEKSGGKKQVFTPSQRRRLEKLGIDPNSNPEDLNDNQKRRFSRLNIDPASVTWTRVIDTNDRFLRKITIGQASTEKGRTRSTKFTISVASELMAILALTSDFKDTSRRVASVVIGFSKPDETTGSVSPITCEDLCVEGAVCALLRDAVHPTLMQTLEGTPVLVHCGPFANIAHGSSSIIADKLAMDLVGEEGYVITECGFASDIGFEKFINIKCRYSGLMPNCAILVVTVRAIKMHGRDLGSVGDSQQLESGMINMKAHITNIVKNFGVPCVVALNKFVGDRDEDIETLRAASLAHGATEFCVSDNWALGGEGAINLANGVIQACSSSTNSAKFLYETENTSIFDKLRKVATTVYGAKDISLSASVKDRIKLLENNGFGKLPVCIAKTQMSISHDPKLKGAPKDYVFPIIDINVSAGAGFVYALAGEISTMPGLPTRPAFFDISIDPGSGQIDGLI
ncbi:C-1-tetrahydrofolate synthase, cytoplasmic, partial [Fragariocoptes setiger]